MNRRFIATGVLLVAGGVVFCLHTLAATPALTPTALAVGSAAPADVLEHIASPPAQDTAAVDVIFVSKDCTACRALVSSLVRSGRQPKASRRVVFITDAVWPQLGQLDAGRIAVSADAGRAGRAAGVRGTPTIATVDSRSGTVVRVGVGLQQAYTSFAKGGGTP